MAKSTNVAKLREENKSTAPRTGTLNAVATSSPASAVPDQHAVIDHGPDYFITRDGLKFAGAHVLADFWGATHLSDLDYIEAALRSAVSAAKATLLHIHLHHFGDGSGVSGVAVLAESHISIHTWPEREFAAIDVFMCGGCDPLKAIAVLQEQLGPRTMQISDQKRGVIGLAGPRPVTDPDPIR